MTNEKKRRYRDLVEGVKKCPRLNVCNAGSGPKLCRCEFSDEINLWSYWQGGEDHLDADILLVGQDWGHLNPDDGQIVSALKSGTYQKENFCYMKNNTSITDLNLCRFFDQLGFNIQKDYNSCEKLFFTNLVLCYREDEKISGGMKSSWVNQCTEYFRELVEIIQPKVILCLGRSVFEGVLKAGIPERLLEGKNYNQIIENGPIRTRFGQEIETMVFPLAHCGSLGTMNRNRGGEINDPLDLQKKDWEKVRAYLESKIKPGRYRHYKGNEYQVLFTARHSETEETLVIYKALYGAGQIWARPASMWNETIEKNGERVRRFTYIGE